MKNILLVTMLLILNLQAFADEDSSEVEIVNLAQPIFGYTMATPKLNLPRRNPLFFSHYGLFSNMYGKNVYENIFHLNSTRNEQNVSQNSQENNWLGFLLIMAGYSIIWTDAYRDPLRYRYLENEWERYRESVSNRGLPAEH
jgi:hypothetical protein